MSARRWFVLGWVTWFLAGASQPLSVALPATLTFPDAMTEPKGLGGG